MRGLIRVFLASLVVAGAVMTASPAHATPGPTMPAKVVRSVPLSTDAPGPGR